MSSYSLSDRAVSTHEVTSIVAQVLSLPEQRITLYNISWDTYELLLEAFGEHRAARLTYDSGGATRKSERWRVGRKLEAYPS